MADDLTRLQIERAVDNAVSLTQSDANRATWLAGVEAKLAQLRTPTAQAIGRGVELFAGVAEDFRKLAGHLPWAYTEMGKVIRVERSTKTFRASLASDALHPAAVPDQRRISYGAGVPRVGQTIPVHFPVRVTRSGHLRAEPDPEHLPWAKVPGGEVWLYYRGWDADTDFAAFYRAPLPPEGDTTFEYTPDMVIKIANLHDFPDGADWAIGGPGHFSGNVWADDRGWQRFATPEQAPGTPPYPTILRKYPNYGVDQIEGAPVASPDPFFQLNGTQLGQGLAADYLLGSHWYSEAEAAPPGRPDLNTFKNLFFDLTVNTNGVSAATVALHLETRRNIFFFDAENGYYIAPAFLWTNVGLLNAATGWLADTALGGWWAAGQRVNVWPVILRVNDPFTDDLAPVTYQEAPGYLIDAATTHPSRVHLYVSTDAGTATIHTLEQPAGWAESFMIRSTGGAAVRAWWAGHATQAAEPGGSPISIVVTPSTTHLWRGEADRPNGTWQWTIKEDDHALNNLIAVNQDASVVLAAHVDGAGDATHYLTQDAGEHWQLLPQLPFIHEFDVADVLHARLIDLD